MSETPRDPNPPDHDEWLPDEGATTAEPRAEQPSGSEQPTTAEPAAFDQGAIERERNRRAQEAAASGVAVLVAARIIKSR